MRNFAEGRPANVSYNDRNQQLQETPMTENLPQQVDVKLPPDSSSVVVAKVVYGLHALSIIIGVATGASIVGAFLFGWPSIVAVILNYVMRSDARGTYVESHFSWQIRTFWYAFGFACLVGLVGLVLSLVYVGLAIWFVGFFIMSIWVGYRIIRGAIRLWNGKPIA